MSQMYSLGSGNRWEPTAPDAAAAADADQADRADDHTQVGTPSATRSRLQPAALVTGAAAVVLLAGALGGFAVGRASADDDAPTGTSTSSGTDGSPSGDGRPFPGSVPGGDGPDGTDVSWYVVDVPTTRSA
jgi:hypothetical protein